MYNLKTRKQVSIIQFSLSPNFGILWGIYTSCLVNMKVLCAVIDYTCFIILR